MNILHIIPTLGCGGAETLVGNLAIQQAKIGHNVKIVLLESLHYTFEKLYLKPPFLQSYLPLQGMYQQLYALMTLGRTLLQRLV